MNTPTRKLLRLLASLGIVGGFLGAFYLIASYDIAQQVLVGLTLATFVAVVYILLDNLGVL